MTLALLLTAVTGAWADGTVTVKELTASEITAWANDDTNITAADLPGFVEATTEQAQSWDGYPTNGTVYLIYGFDNGEMKKITYVSGNAMSPSQNPKTRAGVYGDINRSTPERYFYVTGITGVVEPAIDVKWDAATKTGTFVMPAFDVEIAPIYAPVAQWAKVENVDQLPTAAEGIYAESTDAIVTAGTVAKIGETENVQGTLMYAVGTSATEQPALTAFSADVPTAKDITAAGDVYVWYYIKGADTPQGQTATADNTFNDSEICATPIKVTVLNNKFDIQFNAANANTIEAGKATVTVGGTAATVTEGKLQGVKMGSEVKVKANTGYKFRKVEVKKKAAGKPLANATTEDLGKVVGADGKIYANKAAAEAANTTAVAMICYVNEGHGLALALSDEGDMDWSTAKTTCAAHTPAVTGATWKLASKLEMNLMINAAGNYAALRDGFSAVGGTNMIDDYYWVSDESSADYAKNINFGGGYDMQEFKDNSYQVRACLAF